MIGRRQLTVASPISLRGLSAALAGSFNDAATVSAEATELVRKTFGVREAVLTDSGTSALVLALRLAAPNGGTVAYPSYACVDLAAAARYAGVRVRLYDLDPDTLSPDLDSVGAVLDRGVDAIVVAHLFGYPADVVGVRALAAPRGVTVVEDAAQGAGGSLGGQRLGSIGDLSLVSFGRGKGLCAGSGGALLTSDARWANALARLRLAAGGRGFGGLAKAAIQWALGRPSVYAIPSMIPWLRLGQMVYHPASEPTAMDVAASALLESAFALEREDLITRRANARALDAAVQTAGDLRSARTIDGAAPGYLRYAVRDLSRRRAADARLGVARPYPVTMAEQVELAPVLVKNEPPTPGADALRDTLFTLPTHRFVDARDIAALRGWISTGKITPFPEAGLSTARDQ
jgi:dTDP-4-amino-4,6-dideoxygalactose transaminase